MPEIQRIPHHVPGRHALPPRPVDQATAMRDAVARRQALPAVKPLPALIDEGPKGG